MTEQQINGRSEKKKRIEREKKIYIYPRFAI